MNAQELFGFNSVPVGIYYCDKCRTVRREREDAEQCCVPAKCECGVECEPHRTRCDACAFKSADNHARKRWESASTRTHWNDYKGTHVYIEGEDEPITTDELADRIEEDEAPAGYVYGCYEAQTRIDAIDAIDDALERAEAYDGAANHISTTAREELRAFLDQWSALHMPVLICQDTDHAIIMPDASDRYPFYCVDRGDTVDEEHQYCGPFTTHDEAVEALDPDVPKQVIRRCRQLKPSEVAYDTYNYDPENFEVLSSLVDDIDEAATSGNLPEGAWHYIGERVVSAKYDDDTLPTKINFSTWIDDRLTVDAWICEGDE